MHNKFYVRSIVERGRGGDRKTTHNLINLISTSASGQFLCVMLNGNVLLRVYFLDKKR
jgi:hypothetical protein